MFGFQTLLSYNFERNLCYVISVDKKIYGGVELHKIELNLNVPKILERGLNLKKNERL